MSLTTTGYIRNFNSKWKKSQSSEPTKPEFIGSQDTEEAWNKEVTTPEWCHQIHSLHLMFLFTFLASFFPTVDRPPPSSRAKQTQAAGGSPSFTRPEENWQLALVIRISLPVGSRENKTNKKTTGPLCQVSMPDTNLLENWPSLASTEKMRNGNPY